MKVIKIPLEGTEIFNVRESRGYVSIKNDEKRFYHKFFFKEDFVRWVTTEEIELSWGDTVKNLLKKSRNKTYY